MPDFNLSQLPLDELLKRLSPLYGQGLLNTPDGGGAWMRPPQEGFLPLMPNMNLQANSRYFPTPEMRGSIGSPMMGGYGELSGSYQAPPIPQLPPMWSLLGSYRRRF